MKKVANCYVLIVAIVLLVSNSGICQKVIPKDLVLTAPLSEGRVIKKASRQIVASNQINAGAVEYVAGEAVILKPGFAVMPGAFFESRIEPVFMDISAEVLKRICRSKRMLNSTSQSFYQMYTPTRLCRKQTLSIGFPGNQQWLSVFST